MALSLASRQVAAARDRDLRPLVVDLDGTLLKTDALVETALAAIVRRPRNLLSLAAALRGGRAGLKQQAAALGAVDVALLPYDEGVLELIRAARDDGRLVYLASACDEAVAAAVASHLDLFDGVFCSDGETNLKGQSKAERLVEAFDAGGFDYIGDDWADLEVWREAHACVAVGPSAGLEKALRAVAPTAVSLRRERASLRDWLKLLRVHQYSKNVLAFAALFAAHAFQPLAIGQALLGFVAFCLCASGVYLLNDVADVQADRGHRTKRHRALAAGRIPLLHGLAASPVLLLGGLALAALLPLQFMGVLGAYLVLTMLYTFWLKQKLLVDVVVLALLYVVRVIAGAAAIAVSISHWFLGFALFIFTCLALVKRYIECSVAGERGLPKRSYVGGDATVLLLLAAAAGFNAVTVLALYVASDDVRAIYARPEWLWLLCPVMLYWIARILVLAQRGRVNDDPIVFAVRDRASLLAMGLIGAVVAAAT